MCPQAAGNSGLHVQLDSLDGEHEHIFSLSLTRPTAKNAIGRQLLSELREAVAMLSRWGFPSYSADPSGSRCAAAQCAAHGRCSLRLHSSVHNH